MLLGNDLITVKQILFLLIGKGFSKCVIWTSKDYLATHFLSKSIRSSQIATKFMDNLISNGIPTWKAQQLVILNGSPRLSKKNLKLLGEPIVVGSVDELSNHMELWERKVTDIHIQGIIRRKVILILEDDLGI